MALHRCPECNAKISDQAATCVHCGFSFDAENLARYQQTLEQRRLYNQERSRKNMKLQLIWLAIFAIVIGLASWWQNG